MHLNSQQITMPRTKASVNNIATKEQEINKMVNSVLRVFLKMLRFAKREIRLLCAEPC